jgi:hypothetical protein
MISLRNTWERVLNTAIYQMRHSDNPIQRYTAEIIQQKKVKIFSFKKMTTHFLGAIRHMIDPSISKAEVYSNRIMNELENDFLGWNDGNVIYIQSKIKDPALFSSILVHEVNHYLNLEGNYSENDEIFLDEFRAKIAEAMMTPRYLTRGYLKKIAEATAEINGLALPDKISLPKGVYYPIPKNLQF